jgi:GDP-4-dehydro-6-deoxy-D-mannose reductase
VLVTGGQGFTGRHLVRHWLAVDGDVRIVALGRSPRLDDTFTHAISWGGRSILAPLPTAVRVVHADRDRYRYVAIDLADTAGLTRLLVDDEVDTVVHLAGSLRDEPFDRLVANNIEGTRSLLEAAVASDQEGLRVILCSSGSVYGEVPEASLPMSELRPAQPIDLYSVTKRAAEDVGSIYRRSYGLDVVVARLFNLIGPGEDERHLAPSLARQIAERRSGVVRGPVEVGPLDTTRDFVDVRDVAGGLTALAAATSTWAESGGVVNVASGIETPTHAVFDTLARLSGLPQPAAPNRAARRLDFARQRADIERLRSTGFEPSRPLSDSLEGMLHSYLDEVAAAVGTTAG